MCVQQKLKKNFFTSFADNARRPHKHTHTHSRNSQRGTRYAKCISFLCEKCPTEAPPPHFVLRSTVQKNRDTPVRAFQTKRCFKKKNTQKDGVLCFYLHTVCACTRQSNALPTIKKDIVQTVQTPHPKKTTEREPHTQIRRAHSTEKFTG